MSDGNRRFACKCGFACEAAWSDKTETYIPKIATPTPTYTKKDSVWWPAICPRCGWRGLSEDCEGGGPMGDTGDYSEVTCPRCGNNVDDDEEAKVEEK
jgi:ribosomal protein L37E